jgi:tetratricopeptide (TPR) repeat protein
MNNWREIGQLKSGYLAIASALLALLGAPFTGASANNAHGNGAHASDAHGGSAGLAKLGKVNFKVECNAAAQQEFNVAMAYYHSFEWTQAQAAADRVLQSDPTCGMAHWAKALAKLDNPFVWPITLSDKALADGQVEIEAARKAGLKSQRERDYVDALAMFYKDFDRKNFRVNAAAFEKAMGQLAQRYPDDSEATVLYALYLSSSFSPADKQYKNQLQAAKLLEPIFAREPNHPGAAHYLIHSYDYPPLAKHGISAARKYAAIAPDSPHALHMPSHIFTLTGLWQESIDTNRRASAAANDAVTHNGHHSSDYMVYAHLQLGQDGAARKVMEQHQARQGIDFFGVAYPYAAIPARMALERAAWQEAAKLPLYPAKDAYPWKKYPQSEALNAYARGIGLAMSGEPAKANDELKRLTELRDVAAGMKLGYWADQIDMQAEVVSGLVMFAEGKHNEGIAALRGAADREDASAKNVVTPGPIVPAREMLATVLDRAGKSADALTEFEKALQEQPNRYRAIAGAAQSAQGAGDTKKAADYSAKLLELTEHADSQRVEIAQAKRRLGK